MDKKTTVLMVLDGFGINERTDGNAIKQVWQKNILVSKDMQVVVLWVCLMDRWAIPKWDI